VRATPSVVECFHGGVRVTAGILSPPRVLARPCSLVRLGERCRNRSPRDSRPSRRAQAHRRRNHWRFDRHPRDSHRAFAEKHALPFLLASDEAGEVAKGVRRSAQERPRHTRQLRDRRRRQNQALLPPSHPEGPRRRAVVCPRELSLAVAPSRGVFRPCLGLDSAMADEARTLGLLHAPGAFSPRRHGGFAHAGVRDGD
jgi:hypothetical protein